MRAPSPEDERAGDKHRLREEDLVAGLCEHMMAVRAQAFCFLRHGLLRGQRWPFNMIFLNDILTDFRSRWLCRFDSEVAG